MKTAGDILSNLFDEGFIKKAQGYSKLFDSWTDVTEKNGIAAAAAHSRIKDIDRGILLVETDHPGWKQIIQTKQSKILNDYRIRFPELNISGISLMLGISEAEKSAVENENVSYPEPQEKKFEAPEPASAGLDAINDEDFKEKLKNLGHSIAEREIKG